MILVVLFTIFQSLKIVDWNLRSLLKSPNQFKKNQPYMTHGAKTEIAHGLASCSSLW